ncbi:Flp pilus assembly protein TadG [Tepidamorphus gemmatus]|uniref:Flp pilus assembly protein TadG n=1 Tax=Tepidamorphus gemmatus TaxID=747076 RepID=A0A4R3M7I8_9HYPH|nr:TadE/TadG family type IV pilus assembly protein [Tepidamorphus gemmatus]TCT07275.1 Flp pilus assembly protein TadG [Tepidamorphus gemmatus]
MWTLLRRFLTDRRGNVAILFGLLLLPMIAMVGVALDYNRAANARSKLTAALDIALLSLARNGHMSDAEARKFLEQNIAAQLAGGSYTGEWHLVDFVQTEKTIQAAIASPVETTILGLLSIPTIDVAANSEVTREQKKIELALVLDNTGSMKGTRMLNLQIAAIDLVDTLVSAAARSGEPDAVRLALVPYTMTVNVGPQYANAAWIDSQGKSPINDQIFDGATQVKRLDLFQSMKTPWAGCVETRPAPYDVTETAPTSSIPATLYVPYFAPDEPDTLVGQSCNLPGYCNNYIADGTNSSDWKKRQGNVAKYKNATPKIGINPIGYQFGPNAGCEIQPLTRLTSNFTSFKTAIKSMTAGGDTNISAGLMWGWHTLSPHGPFGDGVPYGTEGFVKALILMTDGQNHNVVVSNNNQSVYSGIGYIWQNRLGISSGSLNQRIAKLNEKLAQTCKNVKATGIVIYTIRLEHPDVDDSTIRNCASSPDKFFDVTDSAKLSAVFERIAGDILRLRVSK